MYLSPRNLNTKKIPKRRRNFFRFSTFVASFILAAVFSSAHVLAATGINRQINFQGKVVNTDGTNVTNGSYTFLFCIYTTASPSSACTSGADNDAVWRESKSITVTDGVFQTNLGDTTAFASLVDFNTDNIYLGINFNANGQMTPLVRFTAAPYALNAQKVGGLTVTDTTGTLTIPNGETISFAESFSTSGAFATTLTATGTTNVTLPTTGTLATLAGAESLTNKTIGSTGLVFSGATTDITTGTNEDLTVVANGTGIINLTDAVTVSGTVTLSGLSAGGVVQATGGTGVLTVGTIGASSITADSLDFTEFQDQLDLDASTDIKAPSGQAYVLSITNEGTGNSFVVNDANSDTTPFVIDASGNVGIGDSTPDALLDITGVTGANGVAATPALIALGGVGGESNGTGTGFQGGGFSFTGGSGGVGQGGSGDNGGLGGAFTVVTGNGGDGATGGAGGNAGSFSLTTGTGGVGSFANGGNGGNITITAGNGGVGSSSTNGIGGTITLNPGTGSTAGNILLASSAGSVNVGGDMTPNTLFTVGSTSQFQVNSSGAITAATGITSTTGDITATAGNIVLGATTRISNTGVGTFITGTAIGSQTFTTNNIADSGALTIASGSGAALTLNSGTTGTINIGTDASAETINIGNTGAAVKTIAIGNNTQANTITIGDASVTGLSLTDNNWSISTAGAAAFASLSSSGAIAANGGITFDASTDTVGAFTSAGTIDMSTNILTNIGNTGTDFVASTGALTLAGVLTANGGISLSGSQSLAAAALAYVDLGLITHNTTANQGLRLPNAASASPSSPTSGEGYLAWDAAGNQLITYNGSAWTTVGGTSTLDGAYTAGNTITTDSGSNVVITLQEVVTPTSFVIENQDTAGVNAERIFNSIASGTLTNGLLIEQTGAGTMTNGIQIAETAGTITDGILITGTLGNILNSGSIDITGAGAITGATGFNGLIVTANTGAITTGTWNATAIGAQYGGTGINTSASTGVPTISSGTWSVSSQLGVALGGTNATSIGSAGSIAYSTGTAYAFSAVGTSGQALVSGGTGAPTFFAPTAGSIIFAGTSGILEQDNANFFFDNSTNRLGIGTAAPGAPLDIYGTSNALRLSYDGSNYGTLSTASDGTLSFASSNVTESQFTIGTGASVDDSIAFDGASQDYYAGLDHTTGYFTIGTGFVVGSSTLFALDSTGNVGIGTGVTAPGSRLDIASSSTNTTADTTYGQRNTIADTGVVTTGTDTTYGNYLSLSRTGATGGTLNTYGNYTTLTNTFASGSGTTTGYGNYTTATGNTNGTSTLYGDYITATGADTTYGIASVVTGTTAATSYGASVVVSDSTTGANTNRAGQFTITDTGVVTTGTDAGYGLDISMVRLGATGGTINTYGLNMTLSTDNAGSGTSTAYGTLINTGTSGSTNADTVYGMRIETEANSGTTAYGLYVDAGAAAGTEYAAAFLNGNVGVGDATPDALLDVDFTQTSGTLFGIAAPSSVTLAGTLIGQNIDLSSNITATGQSVAGSFIYLPAVTNTGASAYSYNGVVVSPGNLVQNTGAGTVISRAFSASTPNITQTTGTVTADGLFVATGSITTGGTQRGINISATGVGAGTLIGANISDITGGAGTETAMMIGSGWDTLLDTATIDISGAGAITGATGVSTTTVTASSAIAANGGITFDASTDTVGAFTSAGTIDMSTNILTNIGNTGTDFVASTGALTLAGVLTANGGISLSGSQSLAAAALSYIDLGLITHNSTANQGLRLPNAASASPSSPTSGEGYLAWDAAGNQLITYNGSAWTTLSGGGYNLIENESSGLTARTTLNFLGAGVDCVDNASKTECTIAGGSGSDLQGTYGADADGSNVTISLTAADDGLVFTNPTSGGNNLSAFLLSLTQQHTTDAIVVLDMVQSSNAANGVNLTANAIDTETGLAITTNGLTSGKGISIASSSTAFTGNLADIALSGSNAANTGNVLAVSNTGTANANTALFVDHRATGTGNLALRVDDESGDTTPFIVDGDGRVGIGTSSISAAAATERLLQVGSETNRGNMTTYGEILSKGLDRHTALTNIKDIYVYDTTGDSDGGRWVDWATTDNLSWYTETLDDGAGDPCVIATDDRCYKKSFPRKAILVVTTDALYIFDAATNDMWMKFSQNAAGYALGADTNNNPSSVTALNGVIYVGTNGTASGGLYAFDFVNDRMWNYDATDRAAADAGISGRNAAVTYNVDSNLKLQLDPVGTSAEWMNVNDVHVQVLTHTITAATALPAAATTNTNPGQGKVYVGLATDSGVTVINITDRVLLQYSDVTADDYTAVAISRKGHLFALNTTQDQLERWDSVDLDKTSRVNGTFTRKWDETVGTGPALASSAFNIVAGMPDNLEISERSAISLDTEDIIYVGHSLGMAELHDHTTQAFGWVKYFNSTRQTPMMFLAGINDMVLPMDDTSGTQAQDLSIANTDMAILGTPTLGVNGVQGKAINFDNTNDYLCSDANQDNTCDVDTAFNMSTVGWTLVMWFKHSVTAPASGVDMLFEKCVTATPAQATGCVAAYMTTTGTIVVANDDDATWTQGSSYDITNTSTYAYNDNQWHQLVITRSNTADVDSWIDAQGMNLSTATNNTITLDGSQIVTIGASCSTTTGANCAAANATNFWDGQIDDVQFVVGTTTQATMTQLYVRRLYNSERPRVSKKTITVTDATSATSTTITDSGEAWDVNEFAGQIVEITGSSDTDCVGITRRVSGNTATTLTFAPAVPGACTLDTSADFQIDPEKLYGASSSIAGIGITAESPLGEARQMCVGTNSGSDTGGITCYSHQAGPSIVADVYHSQASQTDDNGTDWTGTDYDDIRAVDLSTRTLVMASEGHFTSVTEDVRLGQGLDYLSNQLYMLRMEIMIDGITTAGSTAAEIGFTGGADLAENYYSDTPLEAGTVVAIDKERSAYVNQTVGAYQQDTLGVVATSPGIVLGDPMTNGYPIALVGRVPVKVTNENGPIYAGDRLTSAGRPGYAMRAYQSGRVLGEALADAVDWTVCEGEDPANINATLCTTVLVFVNLTDYTGQSVELAMAERHQADSTLGADGLVGSSAIDGAEQGLGAEDVSIRLATGMPTKQEQILSFLKEMRDKEAGKVSSEMFTGRVSASTEVITPTLYADQIFAKSIKADSIEGLSIWTNQIASLEQKYAGLQAAEEGQAGTDGAAPAPIALMNLEKFTVGSLSVTLDASILGKLALAGGMTVGGEAQFGGETTFAKLASFFGKTLFKGAVSFEQAPLFGGDTAGFAIIEAGARKVRVTFDTPYEKQPIVTATLTNDASPLVSEADESLKQDIEVLEKEYLDSVFDKDIRYLVTEKSPRGFTIVLAEKAPRDLQFSWVVLSVDKAKSFNSEKVKIEEVTTPDSEPVPLPTTEVPVDTTPVPLPETATPETEPVPAPVSPETTTP